MRHLSERAATALPNLALATATRPSGAAAVADPTRNSGSRHPSTAPDTPGCRPRTLRSRFHSGSSGNSSSGAAWLAAHANTDGGWGDTPDSRSNISTTALAWGALNVAPSTPATDAAARKAEAWLTHVAGGVDGGSLRRALDARYGADRTFSVPILTALAIAGRLPSWRHVAQLPFELAAAPHQLFASLRLPVVSYALPPLIAIGQVRKDTSDANPAPGWRGRHPAPDAGNAARSQPATAASSKRRRSPASS